MCVCIVSGSSGRGTYITRYRSLLFCHSIPDVLLSLLVTFRHFALPDLRKMPLAAISASLSALKGHEDGVDFDHLAGSDSGAQGKDRAGYESVSRAILAVIATPWLTMRASFSSPRTQDGGEEPSIHRPGLMTAKSSAQLEGVKNYVWKFSKSPMGA